MEEAATYHPVRIVLHWTLAILIAAQFALYPIVLPGWHYLITTHEYFYTWGIIEHLTVGSVVLLLVFWRIRERRRHPAPPPLPGSDPRMEAVGRLVHRATYIVMLLVPVSGLVIYFGDLRHVAFVHNALAMGLLGLIALHASAALYHQFIRHDGILLRMVRPRGEH